VNINRRTMVRGAAWTAPALAVASTAPAFAVSRPCLRFNLTVRKTADQAGLAYDTTGSEVALVIVSVQPYINGSPYGNPEPGGTIDPNTVGANLQDAPAIPGFQLSLEVTFTTEVGSNYTTMVGPQDLGTPGDSAPYAYVGTFC